MEIWRDIKDYEGIYQVSNTGKIKRLNTNVKSKNNSERKVTERILKLKLTNDYYNVCLCKEGNRNFFRVNRLVAFAFPEICGEYFEGAVCNHKDENKHNNNAENLEWCTQQYNNTYGNRLTNAAKSKSKPVLQYTKSGKLIREYNSLTEVQDLFGYAQSNISNCCYGNRKSAYNFVWKFKNNE